MGFIHTDTFGTGQAYATSINDLLLMDVDGEKRLYSASRDGVLVFDISTFPTPVLLDQASRPAMENGLPPPMSLTDITIGDARYLLPSTIPGGLMRVYALSDDGQVDRQVALRFPAPVSGTLSGFTSVDVGGQTYLFAGLREGSGLQRWRLGESLQIETAYHVPDTAARFADRISATAVAELGATRYLFTASASESGLSAYRVRDDGALLDTAHIGARDGLGISGPTALATATVQGGTYVLMGCSASSTISVFRLLPGGQLLLTDHLADTLATRFGRLQALETATVAGRTYVVAGGGDDGVSLFLLTQDGRLLLRDTFVDGAVTSLRNISAMALMPEGNNLRIYASSGSEPGITALTYSPGPAGLTREGWLGADTLAGGSGADMLSGGPGNDSLAGAAGNDILLDGAGTDTLSGGIGADLFVLSADGATDRITDFNIAEDRLDLSAFAMLYAAAQLSITATASGARILFRGETLEIQSHDGQPIDTALFITDRILSVPRSPNGLIWEGQVITGDETPNTLPGSQVADLIIGAEGNDTILAAGGNDLVLGQAGNDNISGGGGADTLKGNRGRDILDGGEGNDRLEGLEDADTLRGGPGNDVLIAGGGNDLARGNRGADTLFGGDGNDTLNGQEDSDAVYGGAGNDTVSGGIGDDTLAGGAGTDRLFGEDGADTLFGNDGADWLDGGPGNDRLESHGADDTLSGGDGNDLLRGGLGNDTLFGGSGSDTLFGGEGADRLSGGRGADWLIGSAGADHFVFGLGDGTDVIRDFRNDLDTLHLEASLWGGGPLQLSDIAHVQAGNLVLDFGMGNVLTLEGITDASVLSDDILTF